MELHDVSYEIEYVARPLLLFFSSENRLLWFRYREYDLSPLKLGFEFSIYNVWKSVQYGVSNGLDTVYWGFLGVGTTFDIFQNIILIPYLEYDVLSLLDTTYCSLIFCGIWIEEEETNHALMAISSNIEQQLSLNEQLTFQANEIYAKDEKLKIYRRIGMKAVKENEQLQKTVDSWKNSSKNLWKLVDSGMTSNSKVGLGYEIQSNKEVLSYEEEMNRTVFKCTEKDFLNKPLYSRFSKTDNFKGVSHPLTGDYTPKPQEEIDDSLYVYGKKGPQKPEISDSNDNSTEHSTFQSNNGEGSFGNPSEHSSESESESISVPNEMYVSKSVITNERVVSESKEVKPSCATHVKTPRQQMKNQGTYEVKGKN
ncbi:hypothetical protein Tco_0000194 [Tanacetum coccineum]